MAKKKNPGCCPCGDGDCNGVCAGTSPEAFSLDVPEELIESGGAGEEGGDCSEEQCAARTGLWGLTKVPYNDVYLCPPGGFGDEESYWGGLSAGSCLWVGEVIYGCWKHFDIFGTPTLEEKAFVWMAAIDGNLGTPYRMKVRLMGFCEGTSYHYGWQSGELSAGANCAGPIELTRDTPAGDTFPPGDFSCVFDPDVSLWIAAAV